MVVKLKLALAFNIIISLACWWRWRSFFISGERDQNKTTEATKKKNAKTETEVIDRVRRCECF